MDIEYIITNIQKMTHLIQRNNTWYNNRGYNSESKTAEEKTDRMKRHICFAQDTQLKEEHKLLEDILTNQTVYEMQIREEMKRISKQKSILPWKSNQVIDEKIQYLHWTSYDIFSNLVEITFQKKIYDEIIVDLDTKNDTSNDRIKN